MLGIPLKRPTDEKKGEWDKALMKFVSRTYTERLATAHTAQFNAVSEQRKQLLAALASGLSPGAAEDIEQKLVKYLRLLRAMENRFAGADMRLQVGLDSSQ